VIGQLKEFLGSNIQIIDSEGEIQLENKNMAQD